MSDTELVRDFREVDEDDFTDAFTSFPLKFKLKSAKNTGGFPVRHLSSFQSNQKKVCSLNDKGSISIYDLNKLESDWYVNAKENLTGLQIHEENQVICSGEKSVKVWDTRQGTKPVMEMRDTSDNGGKTSNYNCVAVNPSGLVVSGTEQIKFESFLVFWDLRQTGKLQGGYWETHCDDITSVRFRPGEDNILATGCTDGMVNILDLSEKDEDEALVTSLNTGDSVSRLAWYTNTKGNTDNLAILTHTEAVQLWHTPDCGPHTTLDRDLVCHGIRRTVSEYTYIAGLHQRSGGEEEAGLTLVAGSRCPSHTCVRLGQIRNKKVKPCSLLEGAPGVVTSSVFPAPGLLVTGAESGELTVFKEGEEEEENGGKIKSSKKNKSKEKPY